ncbi:MAG: tetratricopeptide repeat protein [Gammaproteobacteria bacterium]|nr:tetratricopeptide repeat protein [Gammaproteobacteria bacterium]MCK5498308.1 tetratricopeptide repeat protein [Gammaproteobacteria bacterium]
MSSDKEKNLEEARSLIELGKNDEARYCLLELLKDDPNNQASLLMLGGSYFTGGKYSEAEMVFERLVLMAPGEGKFSIALFNTLWKSGRTEEALEEIRRFLSIADSDKERETIDQYMQITNSIADDLGQDDSDQAG